MKTKHVICYSGGHSSALVAIEVVRIFGKENAILLNHNINPEYEEEDIKRFKKEVADYLGIPITYANVDGISDENLIPSQFDVCEKKGSFVNPHTRAILCTFVLKTEPFYSYLKSIEKENICCYYGFDASELNRVERRRSILIQDGIQTDFPLALWSKELVDKYNDFKVKEVLRVYNKTQKTKLKQLPKEIYDKAIESGLLVLDTYQENKVLSLISTVEIAIEKPLSYSIWKHANCKGCLKAGQQHWYCVYVHERKIFERAKQSEEIIGYSFGDFGFLKDIEEKFERMRLIGIPASEHIPSHIFWKTAKKYLKQFSPDLVPCECFESIPNP